jgi:hypothetical protein
MTDRAENLASLVELLGLVPSGKATVSVGGRPLISVNADEKTLDVEVDRVGEAGLRLSDLVRLQEGRAAMIGGSMQVTRTLSRLGWRLTLYAEGDRILSMGSGVSELTGRISVNPFRLRKLLKVLR